MIHNSETCLHSVRREGVGGGEDGSATPATEPLLRFRLARIRVFAFPVHQALSAVSDFLGVCQALDDTPGGAARRLKPLYSSLTLFPTTFCILLSTPFSQFNTLRLLHLTLVNR